MKHMPSHSGLGRALRLFGAAGLTCLLGLSCATGGNPSPSVGKEDAMSHNATPEYVIKKAVEKPTLARLWDSPAWNQADTVTLEIFHPRSSDHRPLTQAKLLYTSEGIYVHFRVEDQYVRAVRTGYQAMVCKDSCVEFFVLPKEGKGYFNFEVNCGGTLHLSYVEDPTPVPGGFKKLTRVPWSVSSGIRVAHSLPVVVSPEIEDEVTWQVEYFIPFSVFEPYVGPVGDPAGQTWRANFYKCADETSHPHWGMWAPIGDKLGFHQPKYFAPIRFKE